MSYWAGLYLEDTQKLIKDGVNLMLKVAIRLLRKKSGDNLAAAPAMLDNEAAAPADDDDEAGLDETTREES
jgi:hypothetical protein